MNAWAFRNLLSLHVKRRDLYAGFWRRVVAWIIDSLVIGAVEWFVWLILGGRLLAPWAMLDATQGWLPVWFRGGALQPFALVFVWLYFALCESSRWQATPGKLALDLKVTDEFGARIGFGRATGRYFGKLVSALILGIGFLMAGWTARKQALHDLMAGCCVVRDAGLDAWQREQAALRATGDAAPNGDNPRWPVSGGMPGWAIALIALGACVFVLLPIAGGVTAVAIPAYQAYTVRGQVQQGVELTRRTRSLVAEYIGQRGALPNDNRALGLPRPEAIRTRYVSGVQVVDGKVVVTYGNEANGRINGRHVVMSPVGNAAALRWRCASPDIDDSYLPSHCRH